MKKIKVWMIQSDLGVTLYSSKKKALKILGLSQDEFNRIDQSSEYHYMKYGWYLSREILQ